MQLQQSKYIQIEDDITKIKRADDIQQKYAIDKVRKKKALNDSMTKHRYRIDTV